MTLSRYLKRALDGMKWPQVLVFHEKHAPVYYLIDGVEALGAAFVEVLKQRLDPKYGYIAKPDVGPYGLKPELTQQAAEALPSPYREQAIAVRHTNASRRAEHAEEIERYCVAKKAAKDGDGMAAYQVLSDRKDYEYEGFEFVTLCVPKVRK